MANSKTKQAWADMKTRCTNPNCRKFASYGAVGIGYTTAWETFKGFLADMGEAPEGSCLDRIDNKLGYSKENCRWLTKRDSARNTSNVKLDVRKVQVIKALLRSVKPGVTKASSYVRIAPLFSVHWRTIRSIGRGEIWYDVT